MNKYQKDVAEFHKAFGEPEPDVPSMPDEAKRELRCRLTDEEKHELREGFGLEDDPLTW